MSHSIRTFVLFVALSVTALGLAACDPEEQDRILRYEQGTYLGQPDDKLAPEARDTLNSRIRLQGGV